MALTAFTPTPRRDAIRTTWARHPLHDPDRTWSETNCYVDLWVEVLHSLGLDPLLACGFTLDADFDGTQWSFHKFAPEDLRAVYAINVNELNVWRPLADHVTEQLEAGRLLTVEVDSWFLPDTAGVSYRRQHVKTTVLPWRFDPDTLELGYFHGPGRFEVRGPDTAALLRLTAQPEAMLPPYVESVRLDRLVHETDPALVVSLARAHLARRAADNPVTRMRAQLRADLPWLVSAAATDEQVFHDYAFGTVRQCGAGAELGALYVRRLGELDKMGAPAAAAAFTQVATAAKSLQFALARAARGRRSDLDRPLDLLEQGWAEAMAALVARYG